MRVFVSSVMRGFEEERQVAKDAIEALGMTAVMAEHLGARSQSSQMTCLEGVRESDCYLGIFAERYGFLGPSGEAVTVEEYREADAKGLPILLIVKENPKNRDAALTQFLTSVGEYQRGHFHGRYSTHAQLSTAITKALRSEEARRKGKPVTLDLRRRIADLAESPDYRMTQPSLIVAAAPGDDRADLDIRRLTEQALQERLSRCLRYEAKLFDESLGSSATATSEHLDVAQRSQGSQIVHLVRVGINASVLIAAALSDPSRDQRSPFGFFGSMLIDEDRVASLLGTCLTAVDKIFRDSAFLPPPDHVTVQAALAGCANKQFGRVGVSQPNSMSMSMRTMDDPLFEPKNPVQFGLGKESAIADLADRLRAGFALAFKSGGAYFEAEPRRR